MLMSRANRFARLVAIQQGTEFVLLKHQQGKHDQATHGSWDTDRSNNKSDFKYPVQDAIDKVLKGEVGQVVPADAEFWLDKMADREDNPDLTNLEIVGTQLFTRDNLGIMRDKMPQVPKDQKDEFLSEMEKRGIGVSREDVSPQTLHPIQAEISASKSGKILRDLRDNGQGDSDKARIVVSSDNYVIDGHHRWAASTFLSFKDKKQSIPVLRVDMTHMELIDVVLAWNKASGIESIALGKSNKSFKKAWIEFDLAVAKGIITTLLEKHLAGQHDQSTHGSWATGIAGIISEKTAGLKKKGVTQEFIKDSKRKLELFLSIENMAKGVIETDKKLNPESDLDLDEILFAAGFQMTSKAMDFDVDSEGFKSVLLTKAGNVAGAMAVSLVPSDSEYGITTELHYLGTTGIVDGAGSMLYGQAINYAYQGETGLQLFPLLGAIPFWKKMGFKEDTRTGYLSMSPDEVAAIFEALTTVESAVPNV